MSMPRYRGRHQPRDGRCAGASRFGFQKINGGGIHDAMPPEVGPTSTCLIYPRGAARGAAPAAACCPPELTLSQDAPMHKLSLGSKLVLFATRLDSGRAPAASRVRQADPRVASGDRRDDKETAGDSPGALSAMRPLRPRRRARATRPRSHCCISLSLWSVDCAILPPTSPARMPRTAQRPTRADRPSRPVYCGKLLNGHPPTGPVCPITP